MCYLVIAVSIISQILKYASSTCICKFSKTEDINYLCNVNSDLNFNCKFVRDRKVIVLRNCDLSGKLIDLKTPAKYLDCKPWVLLSVREFEVYGLQTPVPICHVCNDSIDSINTKQTLEMLAEHICHHSRVAANLIRDFDCCWHLDGKNSPPHFHEMF